MSTTASSTEAVRLGAPEVGPSVDVPRTRRPVRLALIAASDDPRRIGRGAFAGLVVALVIAGMAVLLMVNTTLVQGAFDLQELQSQGDTLTLQEQALAQQVDAARTPQALQAQAQSLGMVPVPVPAFLRLSDGAVLGTPKPAPRAAVSTPAKPKKRAQTTTATTQGDGAVPTGTGGTATGPAAAAPEAAEQQASPDAAQPRRPRNTGAAVPGGEGAEAQAPPSGEGAEAQAPPSGDGAAPTGGAGR